ncbi:type II toxin-antitoxin system HicA family toxin [Escherichia coli]|nr:type II toxin-antitoxin system HicA family toxin [Escherichia coli]
MRSGKPCPTGRGAVTKAPGGGSHQKANLNGKRSFFPGHGSKEMPEPLRKKIMKDQGALSPSLFH